MAGSSQDVVVGATGVVWVADTGHNTPTDARGALTNWNDLGLISEDGVTQTVSQDQTEIKAWGGSTVRKIQTGHLVELHFTMLETNPDTVALYYGSDNVAADEVHVTSIMNERTSFVVEVADGDSDIRLYIPDGEVTDHGDVVFKTDQAIGYEVTITCYEDATGVKLYEWLATFGVS